MIQIKNLALSFNQKSILKNISIQLEPGRIYCLLGENGAGKSTLLKCLAGHYSSTAQHITINKSPLSQLVRTLDLYQHLMFLPQALPRIENFTCREFVKTAFEKEFFVGVDAPSEIRIVQRLKDLIDEWQLHPFEHELVHLLSGGEWRRTQLAFAFARQTPFLVLDEPDSHLDFRHISKLANVCRNYVSDSQRSILMATHHLDFAQTVASDFLILKDGVLHQLSDVSNLKSELENLFQISFEEFAGQNSKILKPNYFSTKS